MSLTSLCKNPMKKIKRWTYTCVHIASIKKLSMRNSCKTHKGKEYNVMHFVRITYRGSPPKPCKSLSLLIPMSLTHLSNIAKDNDFMNKSA
jgi:hypothetical protein